MACLQCVMAKFPAFEQGILGTEQGRCGRRSGMPGTQTGKWQSAESFTSKNPDTPHVV